jgi:hypothetical protein
MRARDALYKTEAEPVALDIRLMNVTSIFLMVIFSLVPTVAIQL